jgi:hypothetical protein
MEMGDLVIEMVFEYTGAFIRFLFFKICWSKNGIRYYLDDDYSAVNLPLGGFVLLAILITVLILLGK